MSTAEPLGSALGKASASLGLTLRIVLALFPSLSLRAM